jgi:hypothetical protein
MIGVRLQVDAMSRLDRWIEIQPEPRPGKPEAIRRLIELGLEAAAAKQRQAQ